MSRIGAWRKTVDRCIRDSDEKDPLILRWTCPRATLSIRYTPSGYGFYLINYREKETTLIIRGSVDNQRPAVEAVHKFMKEYPQGVHKVDKSKFENTELYMFFIRRPRR